QSAPAPSGVPVQSMQKVPISSRWKIKDLDERESYLSKQINSLLPLWSISPRGLLLLVCRQPRDQTAAVACQRKRHLPAKVDVLKMHRANVSQQVELDAPCPGPLPRIQDLLHTLRRPGHHHIGEQGQRARNRQQFLVPSAPGGGNTAKVNDALECMDRLAPVEDTQDLTAKPLIAQVIAQKETPQEFPQRTPRFMDRIGPRRGSKPGQGQHRGGPTALNRRRHPDEVIPARLELV